MTQRRGGGQRCEALSGGKLRLLHFVATLATAWMVAAQMRSLPTGEGSYEKMLHRVGARLAGFERFTRRNRYSKRTPSFPLDPYQITLRPRGST